MSTASVVEQMAVDSHTRAGIDSPFLRIEGWAGVPWNQRWLSDETRASLQFGNEVQRLYARRLEEALARGDIQTRRTEACHCGSRDLELLSRFDRFGLEFGTSICRACGLVLLSPVIVGPSIEAYYRTFYHPLTYGKESMKEQVSLFRKGEGAKVHRLVSPFLPDLPVIRVLEIGSGTGSVLAELRQAAEASGRRIEELGTEYSLDCIDRARAQGLDVIYGGFNEVLATGRVFDLVVLSHVFEHFVDLRRALERLSTVLTEHGCVYVGVPGLMTLHKKKEYLFDYLRYITHAHVYDFNLSSLTRVFNEGGFELVYGNEEVEAVFRKGPQSVDVSGSYRRLLDYLAFLEQNRSHFLGGHELGLAREDKIRALSEALRVERGASRELRLMEKTLAKESAARRRAEARIEALEGSASWRLTAPLRAIRRRVKLPQR